MPSPPTSLSSHNTKHCVALLIGINRYRSGIPSLRNAVRDVEAVAEILRKDHDYAVEVLRDEEATLSELRRLLTELPGRLTAETRLVLYFAGHGIAEEANASTEGPRGFLIPQDARSDDASTFFGMAELSSLLAKLPCKHLLLLLDCCFAGAFRWSHVRSLAVQRATLYQERFERYLRDPAWQVLVSAASDERALDLVAGGKLGRRGADDGNSPFAGALCRGLQGAADLRVDGQAGDGVIVASELHIYLESAFERLEQQLGRPMQKPLLWSLEGRDKGQFIFFTPGRPLALRSALELVEKNNPYRGLESYGESDSALFFGRDEVVTELCAQVEAQPLTVVTGISGSGKSSVVRAGLVSRLSHDSSWHILSVVRPSNRPRASLASVVTSLGTPEATTLAAGVDAWCTQHPDHKLLLIIDQLEECVTMGADPAEQDEFLSSLREVLVKSSKQLRIVMTLRADFEPHFAEFLAAKTGGQVRFLVRPPNRQELRQVIECPASERVMFFDPPQLVEKLIDDVAEMPGALPLLSFTMSELYRAYVRSDRSDRCLAESEYRKLNGVAGALSQRADEIFHSLDATHQGTLRRLMLRMVALEAGDVARRRVPMEELHYRHDREEAQRVAMVLAKLLDARLIVSGRDTEGAAYVEPAHDKLLLGWPLLWTFIKQEQESIPLHRLLTQEATAWERNGRGAKHLWAANPRLPLVLELQRKTAARWNTLEGDFIRTSEQQRRRNRKNLVGALTSIIVVLLGLIGYSLYQQHLAKKGQEDAETQRGIAEQRRTDAEMQKGIAEAKTKIADAATRDALAEKKKALEEQAKATAQKIRADDALFKFKQQTLSSHVEIGRQLLLEKNKPLEALLWLHRAKSGGSQDTGLPYLLHAAMQPVDATKSIFSIGPRSIFGSESLSPEGHRIVTLEDFAVRVWDIESGKLLLEIKPHILGETARFSPDGRWIVTTPWRSNALVFDSRELREPVALRNSNTGSIRAAWSHDSQRIVTIDEDLVARVWNPKDGTRLLELKGHTQRLTSATFSPDDRRIATVSHLEKMVRIWNSKDGKPLAELPHESMVMSAIWSPDSRQLVTTSMLDRVQFWEADTGQKQFRSIHHAAQISSVAFRPDGQRIVTASEDKTARVWAADNPLLPDKLIPTFEKLFPVLKGHEGRVNSAAWSADGRRIVTASDDETVRIWDAQTGRQLALFQGHEDGAKNAIFAPHGRHVITESGAGMVRAFSLFGTESKVELEPSIMKYSSAAFSTDGRRILAIGADDVLRVFEYPGGRTLQEIRGKPGYFRNAVFSPNAQRIVTTSLNNLPRIWDARDGRLLVQLRGHPKEPQGAAWSFDDHLVTTWDLDGNVRLWDADGRPQLELPSSNESVDRVLFSPDSRYLAIVGTAIRLWKIKEQHELPPLKGVRPEVGSVSFSPDGRLIAAGNGSGVTQIWDLENSDRQLTLGTHQQAVKSTAFSPDSRRIVTASNDKSALVWDVTSRQLLR